MRTNPLRGVRWLVVVLPLGLLIACGARPVAHLAAAPQANTSITPTPMPRRAAPATKPAPRPAPEPITGDRLAGVAANVEPNTTLGAVVYDRITGQTLLAYHPDRPFHSASLVKLLIAIDVLQSGASDADRQDVARMLTMSDDGLASMFWVRQGGPELVTRTSAQLGLTGVAPPEEPGRWGEVVVTPRDIVSIYRYVLRMPAAERTLIVDALARAPRHAADGFDQHFGIPYGLDGHWAIKQGWGSDDSTKVLHSTGLVGRNFRYVVVLLTEHPVGCGWRTAARSVTAAAGALRGSLG
jgi:hypothetical protein